MLDTPCSEVVWRVLATHSIRQFPLHFPYRASPCTIRFQLSSTIFFHIVSQITRLSGGGGEVNYSIQCVFWLYLELLSETFLTIRTGRDRYRGADKSLARSGRKEARKHVRDARDFNNIETRAVIKVFFFLQGNAPKEIHAILTETLACFLPGRAKDLSASL